MKCKVPRALFLAVLISILPVARLGLSQTSGDPIGAIQAAISAGNFSTALELLQPALKRAPNDARLWTLQGVAYSGQGDQKEALASFQKALKIAPNALPPLHGAAQIEYEAGNPAAIPLLRHLLQLEPNDSTTHGMLAVLAYQQGDCKLATVNFEKAGALFDSRPEGLDAYATCLMRLKEFDRAAQVFQRVLLLKPADRRERQVLAAVQLMARQPQEAAATLEFILQVDPDALTLELAAAAHEDAHDTPEAISLLRRAILMEPQNVNLYVDFAVISAAHQSNQVGINVVSDGIAQQPNAASLYVARGVLYAQLDQYNKAEADFEKANDLDPKQSLSTAAQGLAAMQKNDPDRALASIQEKLAKTPNDAALLYLQGDMLAQKGAAPGSPEFETAMQSAKKAVGLQPTLGPARDVLAKLYLRSGQYKEAAEESRAALKIDPIDQTAVYRLIQALRKGGDSYEIPELLKKLAALRQQSTKDEQERNRYRVVDDTPEDVH
jgi:tetratricopeptide (TPR) repeat protein